MADAAQEIRAYAALDNRYVVGNTYAVALYETTLSTERLTFGQLVSAVMLRLGAANEARAVLTMNRLTNNISFSTLISEVIKKLTEEPNGSNNLSWDDDVWAVLLKDSTAITKDEYDCRSEVFRANPTLENFLTAECGVVLSAALPTDADGTRTLNYTKTRLDAYALIRPVMEDVTRASEILQVDIETDIGRRDVAITAASNIIKSFASSLVNTAQGMKA